MPDRELRVTFHRNPCGLAVGRWFHVTFRRDYLMMARFGAWSCFVKEPRPRA